MMESIEKAFETAYQEEVANLYKVFSNAIVATKIAGKDETQAIEAARDKFQKGLEYLTHARKVAREAAGL